VLAPFGALGGAIGGALAEAGKGISEAVKGLGGLGGAMGTAAVAGGGLIASLLAVETAALGLVVHAASAAAKFNELSQSTGVSVQALSGYAFVAHQSGIESETMNLGLTKLSKAIFAAASAGPNAVNAFTRLNIATRYSSGQIRDAGPVFEDLAAKFSTMQDGTVKTALAMQLFGRGGAALIPVLNNGSAAIKEMIDTATGLGLVLDKETAEAAHKFEQSLGVVAAAGEGLQNKLLKELLPTIQVVADALVEGLKTPGSASNDFVVGVGYMTKGIVAFGDVVWTTFKQIALLISSAVTELITVGSTIGDVTSRVGHLDFSGAKSAVKDGLAAIHEEDRAFVADSSKMWNEYGKLALGIFSKPAPTAPEKAKDNSGVDTTPADKSNKIAEYITKLQQQATAQQTLAGTVNLSAGAIRVQTEQTAIAKAELELHNLGLQHHVTILDSMRAAVARAIISTSEFKASFDVRDSIAKASLAMALHIENTNSLAQAYTKGGQAIFDAELKIASSPLVQKLKELEESLISDKDKLGQNSKAYKDLLADTEKARQALAAFQQQQIAGKQSDLSAGLAQGTNAIREQIAALQLSGQYIGATREELRLAAVQATLTAYEFAHIGVDTASKEFLDYKTAVEQHSLALEDNRVKTEALKYDLQGTFTKTLIDLAAVRVALQGMRVDTIAVDAAIRDAGLAQSKNFDALLLKLGTASDGAKAYFRDFINDGSTAAKQIYDAMNTAMTGIEKSLTSMVVTGKGSFAQLGQSIETSIVGSGIHNLLQTVSKGIAGKFGVDLGLGGKRDGNTANTALFVTMDQQPGGLAAAGILPLGPGFGSGINLSSVSGGGGILGSASGLLGSLGKIGGGFGGFLGKIGGLLGSFGGFLAGGGSTVPGRSYIVGENGPERFTPPGAGTIVPGAASSGTNKITNLSVSFNGVTDHDSFRRSQAQMMRQLGQAVQAANGRG
jgi:hypothetical protein